MIISDKVAVQAAEHLGKHDALLKGVIKRYGPCTIRPHKDYYQELVDSIISQQLSVKAAAAIEGRFRDMFGGQFPSPEQILTKSPDELRAIGFSYAKGNYVRDLAQHVLDGKVRFDHLDTLTNKEVATELTAVKGIGEWTAHMFLMFCMGRSDVLPVGDLGIRNGIRALYGLSSAPSPDEIRDIAHKNQWHPYESIASWYIWQSLDNKPAL
ncbi:DNA-3-methyladenine glycosylase [soil metagenome]